MKAQKISKMEVVEAEPPELTPVNHVFLAGRQGHLFTRASRLPIRVLTSSICAPESRLHLYGPFIVSSRQERKQSMPEIAEGWWNL